MAILTATKGSAVRCPVLFTDADDVAADPSAVVFKYWKPGASAATTLTYGVDAAVTKDSVGNYHVDLTGDTEGTWRVRWTGTGLIVAAREYQFRIMPTEF